MSQRRAFRRLHEHSVWQVLASYGIASWLILQVTETVSSLVGLPLWMGRAVLVTLLLGLPIILVTALVKMVPGAGVVTTWPARVFTWKNALLGGLGAFVLLAIGTGAYLGMRNAGIGPIGTLFSTGALDQADPVILADFENQTSDSTLSAVVTEIVRIDLQRSEAITLMEQEAVAEGLARMNVPPGSPLTQARAQELSAREGVKAIIGGSIVDVAGDLVVSARVVAGEDGRDLIALRETASGEGGLIEAVDRLSTRLRERVGESLISIRASEPLAQVTTTSIDALRLYTQGSRAWDRGETELALTLFDQALQIDSEFASAYRSIAILLGNRDEQFDRMIDAATRAYEHRDRLPLRERFLVVAYFHTNVSGDTQAAIDAYLAVLELVPDDHTSVNNLGALYSRQHDFERSDEMMRRAVALEPTAVGHLNLVDVALKLGQLDSARARLEVWRNTSPVHPFMILLEARVAAAAWDWDRASVMGDSISSTYGDNAFFLATTESYQATTAYMRGRLEEAERRVTLVEQASAGRATNLDALRLHWALASADVVLLNDPTQAQSRFEAAAGRYPIDEVPSVDRPYAELVEYHARMGTLDQARFYIDEMASIEAFSLVPSLRFGYLGAAGRLALAEDRPEDALELFRSATEANDCLECAWSWIGEAHDVGNQPDSAIAYYHRFLNGLDRDPFIDVVELPRVLLRLAELYEERGEIGLAIEYYGRFVELWDEADPELQGTVSAVRQRVAALAGEPRG